jgi:ribosome-associated protein
LDRVRALVSAALREPRSRKASRPSVASRERRIETKKRRSALKRERAREQD